MHIIHEKSISTTKQELPSIVREAASGYETIARNQKSLKEGKVSILSTEIFEEILDQGFKFYPEIEEDQDKKGYTIAVKELMIHGEGATIQEALRDLAENIMDYAEDYLARIEFFRQVENRKGHYPYVRRMAKCSNLEEAMEVLAECHTSLLQAISKP